MVSVNEHWGHDGNVVDNYREIHYTVHHAHIPIFYCHSESVPNSTHIDPHEYDPSIPEDCPQPWVQSLIERAIKHGEVSVGHDHPYITFMVVLYSHNDFVGTCIYRYSEGKLIELIRPAY